MRHKRDAAHDGPANAWDAQSCLGDPARDQSLLGLRSVEPTRRGDRQRPRMGQNSRLSVVSARARRLWYVRVSDPTHREARWRRQRSRNKGHRKCGAHCCRWHRKMCLVFVELVHVTITTYPLEILALSLKITFRVSPSRPTIEHGIVWVLHVVRRGFVYLWLSCNPSEYHCEMLVIRRCVVWQFAKNAEKRFSGVKRMIQKKVVLIG
jgi:hypothetical protein